MTLRLDRVHRTNARRHFRRHCSLGCSITVCGTYTCQASLYDKPCKELFVSEILTSFDLGTPAALDAYYKPLLLHLPVSVSEAEPLRSDGRVVVDWVKATEFHWGRLPGAYRTT
jgi:hypothetical protein